MYKRKSFVLRAQDLHRSWYLVNAQDKVLGRVATQVAALLMGKNNPKYTPNVDSGDFVVVINAAKVKLSGKKWSDKNYYSHSGYVGGLTTTAAKDMLVKDPTRLLYLAVKGMLPKNAQGDRQLKKLKLFADEKHDHAAQKPVEV